MAQPSAAEELSPENMTIVDTDAHTDETDQMLAPYIEEVNSAIGNEVANYTSHENRIRSGTRAGIRYTSSYHADSDVEDYGERLSSERSYTIDDKLKEMNEFGIDKGIVSPTLLLNLNTTNNPEFGYAYAKGYNLWLEDNFLDKHEGVKGLIVVSRHKPNKSAEEIDRLADEDDIVGVHLGLAGLTPPLGDPEYDPIYEAAEKNDLPLVLHGSAAGYQWNFPIQYQYTHTGTEDAMLASALTAQWQLVSSICKGLPERFSDLKIIFQEAGISWIPYIVSRMDDFYLDSGRDLPLLDKLPSEYIDENYYFTTQPIGHTDTQWASNKQIAMAIEMTGPESIMYSADLPHPTFDAPEELLDKIKGYFDADTVKDIMGETAVDVYGL